MCYLFSYLSPPSEKNKLCNKFKDKMSVTRIKCLSVVIDRNVNWKAHIHELTKTVPKGIGFLSKLRHFVPTQTLCEVYCSTVIPFSNLCVNLGKTYKIILRL